MIVSSKSQMKTRSGPLAVSVLWPFSEPMLRVGLGWACRRPRARFVVVGVPLFGIEVLAFGDMEMDECGDSECGIIVGVVACASVGLSGNPAAT